MKVAFITRSTLFNIKGGDTIQMVETARHLEMLNISIDIKLTHEKIDYKKYDLLHFFNIIRPADILHHLYKTTQPFVLSPILVDYSEYDRYHRKGVAGTLFRLVSPDRIEYLKTIARWLKGKDKISSISYWWKGQKRCVKEILIKTPLLLPNSHAEYNYIVKTYGIELPYIKVADAVDPVLFSPDPYITKDPNLVLCVARVEGLKNQLNLIKALNNTPYKLIIIGAAAPNQQNYYRECRKIAAENIIFTDYLPQNEIASYYQKAKVHILPSWFEVCGLSSLEAGAMGCNVVITCKGFAHEYFEDLAFYCDPASPASILNAVEEAMQHETNTDLQKRISKNFTWQNAAEKTLEAYRKVLKEWKN